MNKLDLQLKELYNKILIEGVEKADRTNVGTLSIFGYQMRFDLRNGFPLTILRKIHTKSMIHELLWFLESYDNKYKKFGNTNIKYLVDNGVNFWTDWVYDEYKRIKIKKFSSGTSKSELKILSIKDFTNKIKIDDNFALEYGDLGKIYGKQWTNWGGYEEIVNKEKIIKNVKDNYNIVTNEGVRTINIKGINQINKMIDLLKNNPNSRRMVVSAWNVEEIDDTLLSPCHILFQFYTEVIPLKKRLEILKSDYNKDVDLTELNTIDKINILKKFNVPERYIDLQLYMRSNDVYLGQPYNIASYSLLLSMIGQIVNMIPRYYIHTTGDTHLYSNSLKATKTLLERSIKKLPELKINKNIKNIKDF